MATEEAVHTARDVSDAFVKQYFVILEQMPHVARKLYVDSSVLSRQGPDGSMLSVSSVEAIHEKILSCDYEGTDFEVVSVDSQKSGGEGIFIMVIGNLTGKDNIKKMFSQMFYLARDANQNNAYVVLNDILRCFGEEAPKATLPVVESVPVKEMVKLVDEVSETDASAEISVKAAEVKSVVVAAPLENGNIKPPVEKTVTAQKPKVTVAETAAAPPLDGAKRSFAAIVQSMASSGAPFQVKAAVQKPKPTGQPRAAAAPQAHVPVRNFERKTDQKIVEEPGTSIFVANLPMNAMPPQLHELFKEFGPIRENGIQVRGTRSSGICFGFVAFESATSVQNVLQAAKNTPFLLADRKLRVKEKQVEYDGSKPSSGGRTGGGGGGGGNRIENNGSADGGDEFKRVRNRRNGGRNERRGDRNIANGDNNKKTSEGGAPEVQA
ncbi:unnamed protein product [Cochlearia groenlandica]